PRARATSHSIAINAKKTGVASAIALPIDSGSGVPAERPLHGLAPACEAGLRLVVGHPRFEAALGAPVRRHFRRVAPETHAEAREVRGAERRRLGDLRSHDRHT